MSPRRVERTTARPLRIIVPARAPSVLVPVLSEPAQAPSVLVPVSDQATVCRSRCGGTGAGAGAAGLLKSTLGTSIASSLMVKVCAGLASG